MLSCLFGEAQPPVEASFLIRPVLKRHKHFLWLPRERNKRRISVVSRGSRFLLSEDTAKAAAMFMSSQRVLVKTGQLDNLIQFSNVHGWSQTK